MPKREIRAQLLEHVASKKTLFGNGPWELSGFGDIYISDVHDDINEDTIVCEFANFTKAKKLPKKVKEIIDEYPSIHWFLNDRSSRNTRGVKKSRGEFEEDTSED